jgi:hypothetical protein
MSMANRQPEHEQLNAPPELVSALKQVQPARVFVPPSVDEAVLRAARQHLVRPEKARFRVLRSWFFWPAFVTTCLLLAGLAYFAAKQALAPFHERSFAREDVNHDRRVDILDAFELARKAQSSRNVDMRLDLNGDGVVDQRDAEVIATHSVKLEKGDRS